VFQGGSLPFKDRRLNVSEAVRKIPPVMHQCDGGVDHQSRLPPMSSQHPNRSVMSNMGTNSGDPNLPCSLLSQLSLGGGPAGMNEALSAGAAAAGLGLPCHGGSSGNSSSLLYNYFYPSSPMTPGYPVDVGMGFGSPYGGNVPPGSWTHPQDQIQWGVPPGQQQPIHPVRI
jgi:hypothetical protein